jgi:Protein of unknown function (DUF2459)
LEALPTSNIRKLVLSETQYIELLLFFDNQLVKAKHDVTVAFSGYGADDRFFAAQPEFRYSALFTCNNWTSAALKRAGVRIGVWTPMPGGVMRWF